MNIRTRRHLFSAFSRISVVAALLSGVADSQSLTAAPQQVTGTPGVATRHSVINLRKLALGEAEENHDRPEGEEPVLRSTPLMRPAFPLRPPIRTRAGLVRPRAAAAGSAAPTPFVPSPITDDSFPALEDNGTVIPPDTMGAVGLNHLMTTLNNGVRIQNRLGTNISTVSLDAFWGTPSFSAFDPKVVYDAFNGRWIFAAMADAFSTNSAVLLAVSQDGDPTGNWYQYSFPAFTTNSASTNLDVWADYPSLGHNKDWIVISANMFGNTSGGFDRTQIYVVNKTNVYANGTGLFTTLEDVSGAGFTQSPAVSYDTNLATMYLVETTFGSGNELRISEITGPVDAPVINLGSATVTSPTNWSPFPFADAPQSNSVQRIAVNDDRMHNVLYRNGSLWCTHTVFFDAPERSSVQWWQLTPGGGITQRGLVDDPTNVTFFAFPSIAVNAVEDAVIGFSSFSSNQFASASYVARAVTDPPSTMRNPAILKAGEAPYFKTFGGFENRWGDYSATVVDPRNDSDFWTIQEYAATPVRGQDRWGTWWGRIDSRRLYLPYIVDDACVIISETGGTVNGIIEPGETVTVKVSLKNIGAVDSTNLVATLLQQDGVLFPTGPEVYGALIAGGPPVSRPFTFTATGICGDTLIMTLKLDDNGTDLGMVQCKFVLGQFLASYANPRPIIIPRIGAARPSPIVVRGFQGRVSKVSVTLSNLNHSFAQDLDVLLVGPRGQRVLLMSDVGGGTAVRNAVLTFDDTAKPIIGLLKTGTYKPSNVDSLTDSFPVRKPYGAALSAFKGVNPNGRWTLYVNDDRAVNSGFISGGWSLTFTGITPECVDASADLSVTASSSPEPGQINVPLNYDLTINNSGPNIASDVIVTNILSRNVVFVSASASRGTLTNIGSNVIFRLGALSVGASATARITVIPAAIGPLTNITLVTAKEADPNPENNRFELVSQVITAAGVTANPNPINIPASGAANPYPSTITVSGFGSSIANITVTLNGLTHGFLPDLDILLVGPNGQAVMLMSDTGGGNASSLNLVFDDAAPTGVPASGASSGIYRPTDLEPGDTLPNPAPPGPYSTSLSSFVGSDPNGQWQLFIVDDAALDSGVLSGGWSLNITTAP